MEDSTFGVDNRPARPHSEPYHVIRIVEDNVILVSTIGRFRVKVAQTNEILSELVSWKSAKQMRSRFNNAYPGLEAVIVPYRVGAAPIDVTPRGQKPQLPKTRRFLI